MSLETIIAALIVLIETVPGLGHLYPYERVLIPPDDVHDVFGVEDPTATRGWSICASQWYRNGKAEERMDLTGDHVRITHHLNLRRYWEQNDAWQSEVTFCAQNDAICALLRNGKAIEPEATLTTMPQVPEEGRVVLGEEYLCHHARITIDAQEYLDIGEPED